MHVFSSDSVGAFVKIGSSARSLRKKPGGSRFRASRRFAAAPDAASGTRPPNAAPDAASGTRHSTPDAAPLFPIALRALRRPSAGSEPSAVARLSIGRGEPVACRERGCAEASVARCIIGGSKGSPPAHAKRGLSGGGSAGPFGKARPCARGRTCRRRCGAQRGGGGMKGVHMTEKHVAEVEAVRHPGFEDFVATIEACALPTVARGIESKRISRSPRT